MYTIGEVAKQFHVPVSTLRYYDKEGLLKEVQRASGIRQFQDSDIETLRVIECLKKTGMKIKDIKLFLDWCVEGDETISKRREMFYERKKEVEMQMEELKQVMDFVLYKCDYYDKAYQSGTEKKKKETV